MKPYLLLALLALLGSCAQHPTPSAASAEVRYLGPSEPGTTHLQAQGCSAKPGAKAMKQQAVVNAFETVFFRGVPGSEVSTPLVANEAEARRQHAAYWQEFYDEGRYRTFLVAQAELGPRLRQCAAFDLTINHVALRKDLEQHGVIRRFGY